MRVIILAAGQGTRLRPYTNDRPKCMVELNGKPLLHYQLEVLESANIRTEQIALVGGYLQDKLNAPGVRIYTNERYAETNMVTTLFCAEEFMRPGEDLLIAYGDIVYEPNVLKTLLDTEGEIVLAADKEWRRLWSLRMEEPLKDAETFKMEGGRVIELGKKPKGYDEIQAQYMGLIKIRGDHVQHFINFFHAMDKHSTYDGKNYDNMYMTSLIQAMIDIGWKICPALISNGWLEIDSASELELYENLCQKGRLNSIYKHHQT